MTGATKRKQPVIYVSSSSDGESETESVSQSESDPDDSDEDYSGDSDADSGSGAGSDSDSGADADSDAEEGDKEGGGDESNGNMSEEDLCKRVIDFLQRRKNLDNLKLLDCRAYLRKHGLRVSGTKATCVQRILEHWRIKDGIGEKLYPMSSFHINCTGDVCQGDTILFWQRVYETYDKVTRCGKVIGKRTIAGRVVKESYGERKQQHTFTVEVLWSKGEKALSPLHPLRVKGRNLYRLKTYRQSWDNENKRVEILAEKHKRGAAARHIRGIAKARKANKGLNPKKRISNRNASMNKRIKQNTVVKRSKLTKNTSKGVSKQQPSVINTHVLKERNQDSIVRSSKPTNDACNSVQHTSEHRFNVHLAARRPTSMSHCILANNHGINGSATLSNQPPRVRPYPLQFDPRSSVQLYAVQAPPQFHPGWERHPFHAGFQLHPRHPY